VQADVRDGDDRVVDHDRENLDELTVSCPTRVGGVLTGSYVSAPNQLGSRQLVVHMDRRAVWTVAAVPVAALDGDLVPAWFSHTAADVDDAGREIAVRLRD
jgi:hypothetical protein